MMKDVPVCPSVLCFPVEIFSHRDSIGVISMLSRNHKDDSLFDFEMIHPKSNYHLTATDRFKRCNVQLLKNVLKSLRTDLI
jgi:hypothetical protein